MICCNNIAMAYRGNSTVVSAQSSTFYWTNPQQFFWLETPGGMERKKKQHTHNLKFFWHDIAQRQGKKPVPVTQSWLSFFANCAVSLDAAVILIKSFESRLLYLKKKKKKKKNNFFSRHGVQEIKSMSQKWKFLKLFFSLFFFIFFFSDFAILSF